MSEAAAQPPAQTAAQTRDDTPVLTVAAPPQPKVRSPPIRPTARNSPLRVPSGRRPSAASAPPDRWSVGGPQDPALEVCNRLWVQGKRHQERVARKNARRKAEYERAERGEHGFHKREGFFTPRINPKSRQLASTSDRSASPVTPWRDHPTEARTARRSKHPVITAVDQAEPLTASSPQRRSPRLCQQLDGSASPVRSRQSSRRHDPNAQRRSPSPLGGGFVIRRSAGADSPDLFMQWPSEVHSLCARLQTELEQQKSRIAALEDMVGYCGSCLHVDLEGVHRRLKEQRREFGSSRSVWLRVRQFLPSADAVRLRLVGSGAAEAGDAALAEWFEAESRTLRTAGRRPRRVALPGSRRFRVSVVRFDGSGDCLRVRPRTRRSHEDPSDEWAVVADAATVAAPCILEFRGPGEAVLSPVSAAPAQTASSALRCMPPPTGRLPQGTLSVLDACSESRAVRARFEHSRWYPLDGDGVVLTPAGTELPTLTSLLATAGGAPPPSPHAGVVLAFFPNAGSENPWDVTLTVPDGIPAGTLELRYVDSLARPLAVSEPFAL